MHVQISGHKIEVTDALRSHIESKLDRLTRHFDNLTSLKVVLSVEKHDHIADGTLVGSGCNLHGQATETDMYQAIDLMIDRLVAQLRKHKEKLTDHHQREGRTMHNA